jgi:hypothetical protein
VARLQVTGETLDIETPHVEQVEAVVVAPGDELAQVQLAGIRGQTAIAGEEPGDSEPPEIGEDRVEGNNSCR